MESTPLVGGPERRWAERAILDAGGQVALPKQALTGMAWQGYYLDTEGNTFGIHQPDPEAKEPWGCRYVGSSASPSCRFAAASTATLGVTDAASWSSGTGRPSR